MATVSPVQAPSPSPLEIDREHLVGLLLRLLNTPSPAGRTDAVMQLIGDELTSLDVPFELTRRGAMLIELPGKRDPDRAVVVHADTIGAMVRAIRDRKSTRLNSSP